MSRQWIRFPLREGECSRQAHCDLPQGTYEREMGREGFFGPTAVSYTHLDVYKRQPLYLELAAVLREDVQRMSPGDYLPGEMQLAARFSVNRHTLRRAVDELVLEGRLLRRQGKGTQVLAKPLVYPVEAGSAFSQSLSALGHRVEARLIERLRRTASSEECRHLHCLLYTSRCV